MGDDTIFNDPFSADFDDQQSVTPPVGAMSTKGNGKLLVVIFIIDCSMTMKGDRIAAVNAALQELKFKLKEIKEEHNLDMKVAVMSFTSSTKWDMQLTPVEEMNLEEIRVRPGLTEYGAAFHELNKVLRKDRFMRHTGKIAPPAVMFLTDGEPTDDYQSDLDDLLKNGWFTNASRSAVLLGDAIDNASAKEAVWKFVADPENEIVAAEDSTVIMQKLNFATMHTVAGVPMPSGGQENAAADAGSGYGDPFGNAGDPFGRNDAGDPSGQDAGAGSGDPFRDDPFGAGGGSAGDPSGQDAGAGSGDPFKDDPFGAGGGSAGDPSGQDAGAGSGDPFRDDPFGAGGGSAGDPSGQDAGAGSDDPFRDDPFGSADDDMPF